MTRGDGHKGPVSPLSGLERRYRSQVRALAAPEGGTAETWRAWRRALRARLVERLGIDPVPGAVATHRVLEDRQVEDHRRLLVEVDSPAGDVMLVWLLLPVGPGAHRSAVLAVHGHGSGVNEIVGLTPDGAVRVDPAGYQHDFALSLVRRGFVVAAPELLGFGSRRLPGDMLAGDDVNSCHALATWTLLLGTTVIGLRVLDLCLVGDLLRARDDVDESSIGIFGISGGATSSLFAAAIDDRFNCAVLSGYVSSFRASVLAMEHCVCNLVPGLLNDVDMADMALGLSPRPLLLEAGQDDSIFPIAAAQAAAARIRAGYAEQGHADRFEIDVFPGGHEISGRRAPAFLAQWLGLDERASRSMEPI